MAAPVGIDNTFLSLLLNPKCKLPMDRHGKVISNAVRRAEFLVERLGKARQKIILPTPVAAELLTAVGPTAQKYYDIIAKSRLFDVHPFDQICAVELAFLNNGVFKDEDKKNKLEPYQKRKVDRQIIAILKVAGADTLYTDDKPLSRLAEKAGIKPVATFDLPEPEQERQFALEFDSEPLPEIRGENEEPKDKHGQPKPNASQHPSPA